MDTLRKPIYANLPTEIDGTPVETLYESVRPYIIKNANTFSKSTGINPEDLMSFGDEIFVKAIARWSECKKNNNKFFGFFAFRLKNQTINYVKEHKKLVIVPSEELPDEPTVDVAKASYEFKDRMESLSAGARAIASFILSETLPLHTLPTPASRIKAIKCVLHEAKWDSVLADSAISELLVFLGMEEVTNECQNAE